MDFAYFRNSLRILADRNVYLCRSKCVHSSRFCLQELPEAMKWGRLNSVLKRRADCIKSVPWDLWEFICEGFLWSTYPANIYLFKVNNRNTKKVWNIFRVKNKITRTTWLTVFSRDSTKIASLVVFDLKTMLAVIYKKYLKSKD